MQKTPEPAISGAPQAAVGYFVDQKKGEVNELKLVRRGGGYNPPCGRVVLCLRA